MDEYFPNPIIKELLEKYQTIWALGYYMSLGGWDQEVSMPINGAEARGVAGAKLTSLAQSLFLAPEFIELIRKAQDIATTDYEKGVVRIFSKQLTDYQKLPSEFLERFSKITAESPLAWRKAREENNFKLFAPYLEKIVDLNIEHANYIGYKDHPYDALLNNYEIGWSTEDIEDFYLDIKGFLTNLLSYIKKSSAYHVTNKLATEEYSTKKLRELNYKILNYFSYDPNVLRLDVSTHPFSQGLANGDTRITTRYSGHGIADGISSTIHEFGHALYSISGAKPIEYTPVWGGSSLGIHESQSRFWENMVGRNKNFLEQFKPEFTRLGLNYENYLVEDYYRYFNNVKPSLIRVEADEITYHFHTMIRFEIEKALITKAIKVKDVEELWNSKYKDYLGLTPPNSSTGVLQDVHWSLGSIGYFPTYSTGTVLSATWKHYLELDLGNISNLVISKEGINKIKDWLKTHIHQYGGTYTFKDLVQKVTGAKFTTKYWQDYLEEKYKAIY